MYCIRCGKELTHGEIFCSSCGQNQNEIVQTVQTNRENTKKLFAFLIAILTSPILLMIRMSNQKSEYISAGTKNNWRGYTQAQVPDNIKALMIVLLIVSTVLVIVLGNDWQSKRYDMKSGTKALLVLNILVGCFLAFAQ